MTNKCQFCGGFLYKRRYYDNKTGHRFDGHHCLMCGDVTDFLIEYHRSLSENPMVIVKSKMRPRYAKLTEEDKELLNSLFKEKD